MYYHSVWLHRVVHNEAQRCRGDGSCDLARSGEHVIYDNDDSDDVSGNYNDDDHDTDDDDNDDEWWWW